LESNGKSLSAGCRKRRNMPMQDGTHVELYALLLTDLAFLQEEAAHARRRELIETYVRNIDLLPDTMSPEQKLEIIKDAFRRAEDIRADTIGIAGGDQWADNTMRGLLTQIWVSLRPGIPGLTFDQTAEMWSQRSREEVQATAAAVQEISKPTLGNALPPAEMAPAGAGR